MADPKKISKKIGKDQKPGKKNQKQVEDSSDYSDIYDSEGYIDDRDKEILLQKTEKERESILFERNAMREELIRKKKLEKEQNKNATELLKKYQDGKTPKQKALDELSFKRKLEKEKAKKPMTKRKNSEESSISSSNEADDNDSDSDYEDDSGKIKQEDSEDLQKFAKRNDGSKKKSIVSIKAEEKTIELKDIESIRLTRHMLEKMISQPNFEKTVKGCFVRLSVSSDKYKKSYVIAEIIDVMENNKTYKIDIKETKKVLLVKYADKEKKFEINFVSNAQLESLEFANWQEKMEKKKLPMPTFIQISQKINDITEALNYQYNDDELAEIIKKKIDEKISVNSPSNKDLTAEINYFSQRLGTLEYEYFETKSSEKEKQIREIKEKLFILKEKNKKFHEGSKKRDVFEEAMMKKIFGEYFTKKTKLKKKIINHELKNNKTRLVFPNNAFKSFDEKLQQCSNAKEYELIKEEFLQIFQKTFDFEEEIDSWHLDESEIL